MKKKVLSKSDLKTGHLVVLNNGDRFIAMVGTPGVLNSVDGVQSDVLLAIDGYMMFSDYAEDLTFKRKYTNQYEVKERVTGEASAWDINKVYFYKFWGCGMKALLSGKITSEWELLYDRDADKFDFDEFKTGDRIYADGVGWGIVYKGTGVSYNANQTADVISFDKGSWTQLFHYENEKLEARSGVIVAVYRPRHAWKLGSKDLQDYNLLWHDRSFDSTKVVK